MAQISIVMGTSDKEEMREMMALANALSEVINQFTPYNADTYLDDEHLVNE